MNLGAVGHGSRKVDRRGVRLGKKSSGGSDRVVDAGILGKLVHARGGHGAVHVDDNGRSLGSPLPRLARKGRIAVSRLLGNGSPRDLHPRRPAGKKCTRDAKEREHCDEQCRCRLPARESISSCHASQSRPKPGRAAFLSHATTSANIVTRGDATACRREGTSQTCLAQFLPNAGGRLLKESVFAAQAPSRDGPPASMSPRKKAERPAHLFRSRHNRARSPRKSPPASIYEAGGRNSAGIPCINARI